MLDKVYKVLLKRQMSERLQIAMISNLEELDANDAEHELQKQGDHHNVLDRRH